MARPRGQTHKMTTRGESREARLADCRRQVIERGLEVGSRACAVRTFTKEDINAFARITGDLNPYHFDAAFAAASRFGRPIAHGLLVGAMLTEIGGQWAWLATWMTFRFIAPVHAGDTITLEVAVVSLTEKNFAEAEASWTNQDGKVVLSGTLGGYPPTGHQRELLASQAAAHAPE